MMPPPLPRLVFCLLTAGMMALIPIEYSRAEENDAAQNGLWFQAIYVGEDGKDRLATLDLADGRFSLVRFVRDPQMLIEATKNEPVADHLDRDHFRGGWWVEAIVAGDLKNDPQIDLVYDEGCDLLRVTEKGRRIEMHRAISSSFDIVTEADAKIPPATPIGDNQCGRWTTGLVSSDDFQRTFFYLIYEFVITDDDTFEMTAYVLLLSEKFTPLGLIRGFHHDGKVLSEDGQLQSKREAGQDPVKSSVHYDAACDELVLAAPADEGKIRITRFYRQRSP